MIPRPSINIRLKDQKPRSQGHKVHNVATRQPAAPSRCGCVVAQRDGPEWSASVMYFIECPASSYKRLIINWSLKVIYPIQCLFVMIAEYYLSEQRNSSKPCSKYAHAVNWSTPPWFISARNGSVRLHPVENSIQHVTWRTYTRFLSRDFYLCLHDVVAAGGWFASLNPPSTSSPSSLYFLLFLTACIVNKTTTSNFTEFCW